jgi:hypothetical protein
MDPFKVIYKYSEQINTENNYQITGNRDYQSTQLFLWNYKEQNYNSFILGNSRSMFYQATTWNKYIQGNPFHFNASSETIFGILGKLRLLDTLNVDIKNALIILDASTLQGVQNSSGHLFIKHPAVSNESYFAFHLEMLKGFYPKSTFAYADLFFTGKRKDYMKTYGIIDNVWKHDMISNQLTYYKYDEQLKNNPNQYYADKLDLFNKRDTVHKVSDKTILKKQDEILKEVYSILKKHNTSYKVIINPLYDQVKFNPTDLSYVNKLFGEKNVYDFSGVNSITKDYHNYYELSHYRPFVCDSILSVVYK